MSDFILPKRTKDRTNKQYTYWLVLSYAGRNKHRASMWFCRCNCGTERTVTGGALESGDSQSCGCRIVEHVLRDLRTHGGSYKREYNIWKNMRARCGRKSHRAYHNYGGRGVKVCERWRESFAAFLEDMGASPTARHSIERIDNAKGYEPGNCQWATQAEQMRNTRRNRHLTHNGETLTITDWAARLGVVASSLFKRVSKGWSAEEAITTPFAKRHP